MDLNIVLAVICGAVALVGAFCVVFQIYHMTVIDATARGLKLSLIHIYDEIPKATQDEVFSGARAFVKENKGRYECGGYIYSCLLYTSRCV